MSRRRGFSYLEIVVVLAVMTLLFATGCLALADNISRQEYSQTKAELSLALRELRLEAIVSGEARLVQIIPGNRSVRCFFSGSTKDIRFASPVKLSYTGFNNDGSFWFNPSGAPSPRAGTITVAHGSQQTEMRVLVATGLLETK